MQGEEEEVEYKENYGEYVYGGRRLMVCAEFELVRWKARESLPDQYVPKWLELEPGFFNDDVLAKVACLARTTAQSAPSVEEVEDEQLFIDLSSATFHRRPLTCLYLSRR